jgi:hypothetical protein
MTAMVADKVLYTDGHEVTITDTRLQVKNQSYQLKGITRHGFQRIKPQRFPALAIILTGLLLCIVGYFNLVSVVYTETYNFYGYTFSIDTLAILSGCLLMLTGVLIVGLIREKFAVRIETAEGEKDVVISTHQEYVLQIIQALNRAFNFREVPRVRPTR